MNRTRKVLSAVLLMAATGLSACQFQPLYSSAGGTIGNSNVSLSNISVASVDERDAQQVRNHLIFLLSGGTTPSEPSHEVRLRVTTINSALASRISSAKSNQIGNTAGSVAVSASYEIYDFTKKEIIYRGTRTANAAYDKTSQSFASARAERDATNRAAKQAAEQIRAAIAADFTRV